MVNDAYAVTILHRVLIAVAASLLVLAILRRLLSLWVAWVLAAWWAILPINYDTLYEVHLFALLPELAAVLIALSWSGLRMRAAVFGVLLGTAVLVRNEMIVATAVWAAAWTAYEVRERRREEGIAWRRIARAAAIPVLVVALLAGLVVASSPDAGSLRSLSESKHAYNVCQIYTFGYEQRHSDYTGSPWTDCEPLMRRDFGENRPTLTAALLANPGAIAEHFLWNVRLSPYAVQLLLFDRMSGDSSHDPDYVPVRTGSVAGGIGLAVITVFLIGGAFLLWRDRRHWWEEWIGDRGWGWLALGALALTALTVMIWQRPRPSYLFSLEVLILAAIGMCAMAYADRWPRLQRLSAAPPLLAVVLIVAVPRHYVSGYETPQIGRPDRPVKAMVDRLQPFREQLRGDATHLLATYSGAGCSYIGRADPCTAVDWDQVLNEQPGATPKQILQASGADFIYLDALDLQNPAFAAVARAARETGWEMAAGAQNEDRWELLERPQPRTQTRS
ncbi:MAG: hypothetical protein ACJ75Z_00240 [Solirubrobacterales bacterium]